MEKKVKNFLKSYNLDASKQTYLVAFSGGFDSMCLLDILRKISDNKIVAIHLNHNWRGKESDNEEKNCKDFCKNLGIEFYSEKLSSDIAHTETDARNARYDFFTKCAKKFNSSIVFTAHNKNDNSETLIYRIIKGTGINGLKGISPKRDIFYRPLLSCSRYEIETYCQNNNLYPNSDSSNQNTKYKRNYIRQKILPLFSEINPDYIEAINSLSKIATEEELIIENSIKNTKNNITDTDGNLSTKGFIAESDEIQKRLIYDIFIKNKLDYDRKKIINTLNFIKDNASSKAGKTFSLNSSKFIIVNHNKIEIFEDKKTINKISLKINNCGKYETDDFIFEIFNYTTPVKNYPKDNENIAFVDLSNIKINFELRNRKNGDLIHPLGCTGSQKLKKYLNSKHIPNYQKDSLLFLTSGKEILWAINLGINDKIKVKTNPTHCLKFTLKK